MGILYGRPEIVGWAGVRTPVYKNGFPLGVHKLQPLRERTQLCSLVNSGVTPIEKIMGLPSNQDNPIGCICIQNRDKSDILVGQVSHPELIAFATGQSAGSLGVGACIFPESDIIVFKAEFTEPWPDRYHEFAIAFFRRGDQFRSQTLKDKEAVLRRMAISFYAFTDDQGKIYPNNYK